MADPVAVPAELTDALRELGPTFETLAGFMEEVVPPLSSMIPALGGVVEALVAFQPEILAVVEVLKYFGPTLEKIGSILGSALQPVFEALGEVFEALGEVLEALLMPTLRALKPILDALAATFKVLAILLDPVGAASAALAKGFQVLKGGVATAFRAIGSAFRVIGSAASALGSALGKVGGAFASMAGYLSSAVRSAIVDPLARGFGRLVDTVGDVAKQFIAASFGMSGTTDALKLMSGAVQQFIGGITSGVEAMAGAVRPFVEALSPALVSALDYSLRSLRATIGVALVPVAQVLTNTIRQMAAALLPAAQALAPILGKLANIISGFVVNSVQRFAQNLQDMTPLIDKLVDGFGVFLGNFEAVRAIIFAFIDSIANWLKNLLGAGGKSTDWLSVFRDTLHRVVEALVRFSVMLARSLGFSDFVGNLRTQLTKLALPVKGSGAAPAPTDIGFKSFEDIAKTMAAAAFAAVGGAGKAAEAKSEREWLADLAKSLDDIKEGKTLEQRLKEFQAWISSQVDNYGGRLSAWIGGKINEWWDLIVEKASRQVAKGWRYVQMNVWIPFTDDLYKKIETITTPSKWFS